ncbi:MAG TPA: sugar phosphate isomerase/epimerase family protein [Clostridia bacterium]|nr:sugar phosphate isomerase/epimerase family protein [Bacillota bacterium]HRS20899.1 sugar phosphate isomerase/epimerase family protein [Clostridia bacterium]
MKFSVISADTPLNLNMPFMLRGSYKECARVASEIGFDGIELQIQNPLDYDFKLLKDGFDEYDLEVSAVTTGLAYLFEGYSMSSDDKEVRKKTVERLKRHLDMSKYLNSQILLGFIRGRRKRDESEYEFEARLSESMYKILEYAEEIDTYIVFEQINRFDGDVYNSTERTLEFIKKFKSKRLFYNADTYHMASEDKDVYSAIINSKEYLTLFHISDFGRLLPDDKHFNFQEAAKALKEIDYKGWVTLECKPSEDMVGGVRKGFEYMKDLLSSQQIMRV